MLTGADCSTSAPREFGQESQPLPLGFGKEFLASGQQIGARDHENVVAGARPDVAAPNVAPRANESFNQLAAMDHSEFTSRHRAFVHAKTRAQPSVDLRINSDPLAKQPVPNHPAMG
ncbi:hypothetical protein BS618_20115 [Rhodococcus erythropolis]|uniref:hypothetical protein n=1 Tax=Rhodococcus qingshengii TaxID=334542 RepID=UPI000937E895|nr:hypothetical protein [Rhodococcus qingshengii]MCZ4545293.1 hypothetical protein [Rhodococcus qingshengii]OKA13133.1 hypothetical protein BS618_20115 [Rhodococcus erythropolis]